MDPNNHLFRHKHLSWLNARIAETKTRIVSEKKQLAELEVQEINTAHACRRLAIATEYLQILYMRRSKLIKRLYDPHEPDHWQGRQ